MKKVRMAMKAENTRIILDSDCTDIVLIQKAYKELDQLEAIAEIGDAFVWALQEGLIGNIAIEPLVKKYREAVSERKE